MTCSTSCMTRRRCTWRTAGSRATGAEHARRGRHDRPAGRGAHRCPEFLDDLRVQLKAGTFRPLPVRQRLIPNDLVRDKHLGRSGRLGRVGPVDASGRADDRDASSRWARAALSHRIFTGIRRRTLGKLIAELAGPWTAAGEARLRERRDHERLRAAGGGPDHDLVFTDRVIVTLVYLRFQLPHAALAELYRVDRSTISRAVGRSGRCWLAAGSPCRASPAPGGCTLADVFAYEAARGVTLGLTGRKCRYGARARASPAARVRLGQEEAEHQEGHRHHRREGPHPVGRGVPPRADDDQTAVRTEGIADLFTRYPQVKAKVDAGYRGLAKEFPDQMQAPPLKPKKDATVGETAAYETGRHSQSSERICVEHANAETSNGGPSSATSDDERTSTRPSWRSPDWSPTEPPSGNPSKANPPGQHAPTLIAHHAVTQADRES